MIIIPVLASVFLIIAIVLLLKLTPEQVTEDILKLIAPKQNLRDKVRTAQGKKKTRKLILALNRINEALSVTSKKGQFAIYCAVSLCLMFFGGVFAILIDNIFLVPIFSVVLALLPFVYAKRTIGYYHKHIEDEMETALSIITTSYIRSEDILTAIKENIDYIKPPIKHVFNEFIGDVTINPNIISALYKLKEKIDNSIFKEWVRTLIQCQSDRNMKDTLLPVVNKLTDVRIVNNELKTKLMEPRREYFMMVAMVVGNIPLLYLLNKDWYHTLMNTISGKFVLAICGVVILVTGLFLIKFTKPIEYKR
jgi:Flp pilus assembly protein TadB